MSCGSPCGRDIVIPASGLADFADHAPHASGGGYVAGFDGPKTFTWTLPAGLDIASVSWSIEYTVAQGCPLIEIARPGLPALPFLRSVPGTYASAGITLPFFTYDPATRTYSATFQARPSDISSPSILGEYNHPDYITPGHPEGGVHYPSHFSDSFEFELDFACFNLIAHLKCPTTTTEVPSGATETLCADLKRTTGVSSGFLPDWIKRGYGWVIFKIGRADYWAHGPQVKDAPSVETEPNCLDLIVSMPCSPYGSDHLKPGDVIDGPFVAQRLLSIFQGGDGYTYDVLTSQPFNWTQEEICDGVESPPPPPPPADDGGVRGIDVLYWKEGYHVVQVEQKDDRQELRAYRRWHPDMDFEDGSVLIDRSEPGGKITNPRLSHLADLPPLAVVYRKDTDKDSDVYRMESNDYGASWHADPEEGKPFKKGVALAHVEEIWNERTAERLLLFGGSGGISATVYGPDREPDTGLLVKHETYKVVDAADNASFGAVCDPTTSALDCVFQSDGKRKIYRSHDDGRSWQDVTDVKP